MYNCVALQDIRLEVSLTLLSPYDVSHQENLSNMPAGVLDAPSRLVWERIRDARDVARREC